MRGTYISIWDFLVLVTDPTLDVYAEWQKFIHQGIAREEDITERREMFVLDLVRQGKVGLVKKGERIPAGVEQYFGWFFMITDRSADSRLTPTVQDMTNLRLSLGEAAFNDLPAKTREILATGYHSDLMKEAEMDEASYFIWVGDHSAGSEADKISALFRSWYMTNLRQAVVSQGFSVENVVGDPATDPWKTFSYTGSLTKKLGFELILVNGSSHSGSLLAGVARQLINEGVVNFEPFTLPEFQLADGRDVRAQIKEIPKDSPTAKRMLGSIDHTDRVLQLFIADKNNVLPGEEGYDVTFVQEITDYK